MYLVVAIHIHIIKYKKIKILRLHIINKFFTFESVNEWSLFVFFYNLTLDLSETCDKS